MANTELQTVSFAAHQIDGHADREIAAHGGVERDQDAFHCVAKVGRRGNDAIDDGLSVLCFTRLKERRIGTCLDEVALCKRPEQPQRFAFDLAADDERSVERTGTARQMLAVAALDSPHRVRNDDGDVEHRASVPNADDVVFLRFPALLEHTDDGLRPGQVSRAQQHNHPITRALEHGHLAERRKVIDPGIRARVRRQHDAVIQKDAYTVGHAPLSSEGPR